MPATEPLADLARKVLDGTPIDWDSAESSAGHDERPIIRQLRVIEGLAAVHRREPAVTRPLTPAIFSNPARTEAPQQWGHLRILERIGRGAFGAVYRAWDSRLDREVALKLLPAPRALDDRSSTIIEEGRLLARVRHANVVTIHGAERIGDEIGLWMELVRGQTLEQQLKRGTSFTAADTIAIGIELCGAVAAVHAAGLLHRDIKAHNVTRAEDGRVVLMDFGAGRELDDSSSSDLTGTPLYLAPEVLRGDAATVQSDLYCLGVLVYHLLTGKYPVAGRTIHDVRAAHEQGRRTTLKTARPDLPSALVRVIDRATDPEPQRRYANVEALARDLAALQRRPALVRLRNGLIAAAAVLAVALVASEVRARTTGDRRGLGIRVASLFAVTPSYLDNPSIAVMPFRSASSDPDSVLLVDNVTAGLVQQLTNIEGLEVRSEMSSFELKDKPRNLADIGKWLDVNLVVEGDARLSSSLLTINASLVVIRDDRPIFSKRFERELKSQGDVVAIIEELTRKIVDELRLKLGRTQRRYDTNMRTLEIYWRARELRHLNPDKAAELFDEVTRIDPGYGPAWAALAVTHAEKARSGLISPGEAIALAEPTARQALELDPMLAEAHAAVGKMHSLRVRWADAEKAYRYAIFLEPTLTALSEDLVIDVLLPTGRVAEALTLMHQVVRISPLSAATATVLARTQTFAGKYDDALDGCDRLTKHADNQFKVDICGLTWVFKGRTDKALEIFNAHGGQRFIPWVDAIAGRRAEAEAGAATYARNHRISAMIFAALGDMDRAFEALGRLATIHPRRAAYYFFSPELSALRSDPRAAAFRQRLGLPQ